MAEGESKIVKLRGGSFTVYEPLKLLSFIQVPGKSWYGLRFEFGPLSGRIPFSGWAAGLINLAENKFKFELRQR